MDYIAINTPGFPPLSAIISQAIFSKDQNETLKLLIHGNIEFFSETELWENCDHGWFEIDNSKIILGCTKINPFDLDLSRIRKNENFLNKLKSNKRYTMRITVGNKSYSFFIMKSLGNVNFFPWPTKFGEQKISLLNSAYVEEKNFCTFFLRNTNPNSNESINTTSQKPNFNLKTAENKIKRFEVLLASTLAILEFEIGEPVTVHAIADKALELLRKKHPDGEPPGCSLTSLRRDVNNLSDPKNLNLSDAELKEALERDLPNVCKRHSVNIQFEQPK